MYFDDRLTTVLRTGPGGDRAARTHYRQLLDLLGTSPPGSNGKLIDNAYARLNDLREILPPAVRAELIREPGLRLANPRLVATLAEDDKQIVAAIMASARLSDAQWMALVPDLPVMARGFLRHRRDLGKGTTALLRRLGISDLVLPSPDVLELADAMEVEQSEKPPATVIDEGGDDSVLDQLEISALVRRIEAFQRTRGNGTSPKAHHPDSPRLPLGEPQNTRGKQAVAAFDFATDATGRINWCDPAVAPMVVGLSLASDVPDSPACLDQRALTAIHQYQPVRHARARITGAPAITGDWQVDAAPRFSAETGRFLGYVGRMRRRLPAERQRPPDVMMADRMRQILHELRTPVNAIQGFAEIIQQQLYGPAPHEYRALAATIAGDAARILAGFDELDRMAKLESGALELEEGCSDMAAILGTLTDLVLPALHSRGSVISVWGGDDPALVPIAQAEAERLAWRLVATIAGEVTAGEQVDVSIAREADVAIFALELPASLAGQTNLFSSSLQTAQRAISAGMFGTGFTLRLARAEARAAGGDLRHTDDILKLVLPLLTENGDPHSQTDGFTRQAN